jgi:hypothetical protein
MLASVGGSTGRQDETDVTLAAAWRLAYVMTGDEVAAGHALRSALATELSWLGPPTTLEMLCSVYREAEAVAEASDARMPPAGDEAVWRLPAPERAALWTAAEGFSRSDASLVLSLPPTAVAARCEAAHRRLCPTVERTCDAADRHRSGHVRRCLPCARLAQDAARVDAVLRRLAAPMPKDLSDLADIDRAARIAVSGRHVLGDIDAEAEPATDADPSVPEPVAGPATPSTPPPGRSRRHQPAHRRHAPANTPAGRPRHKLQVALGASIMALLIAGLAGLGAAAGQHGPVAGASHPARTVGYSSHAHTGTPTIPACVGDSCR